MDMEEYSNEDSNRSDSNSSSSFILTYEDKYKILLTMGIGGIASIIVCSVAMMMAFKFKLHRYFVHRLAIYQVISALFYSVMCVLELVFINYNKNHDVYQPICMVEAFLLEYTIWVKLMFTFCLTFHLFCFAVFYVNFKKLELVYVLLSIIVPLLFSWVPFIDEIYGLAGAWCWIQNWKDDNPEEKLVQGEIEQYALLYGPAIFCLLVSAVAVVIVTVVLICRAYKCHKCLTKETEENDDELEPLLLKEQKRKKVLREMLPLVAYPILSLMFYVPAFFNRLVGSIAHTASVTSFMWSAISLPLIGLLAGVSLIVHIFILECGNRHSGHIQRHLVDVTKTKAIKSGTNVFTTETIASTAARSHYEPLPESEIDDELAQQN